MLCGSLQKDASCPFVAAASESPSSQPMRCGAAARGWLGSRRVRLGELHCVRSSLRHSYAMHAHCLCNGWQIKNGRHILHLCQLEMFSLIFQQVTFLCVPVLHCTWPCYTISACALRYSCCLLTLLLFEPVSCVLSFLFLRCPCIH